MYSVINFYSSEPDRLGLASFAQALSHNLGCAVRLRPLRELPAPDPARRHALRVERLDVVDRLNRTAWCLEQYRCHQWQPDAGEENGLQADHDALATRLRAIDRVLKVKGGQGNV